MPCVEEAGRADPDTVPSESLLGEHGGTMEGSRAGDLVRAAGAGDRAAWDELVDRYSGLLWSITSAYRMRHSDAADVVQTTWLRLLENLERIRDPDRVAAWLATTARRECQRSLGQSRKLLPTEDERDLEPAASAEPTLEAIVLESERDRALWAAFARLPAHCQRLLRILVEVTPPYEEVAAALDMPIGSIGPTRQRCLERLRRHLVGSGLGVEVGEA
jgi:RNA polymerase sigma factor (sigma-70 family)